MKRKQNILTEEMLLWDRISDCFIITAFPWQTIREDHIYWISLRALKCSVSVPVLSKRKINSFTDYISVNNSIFSSTFCIIL